MSTSKCVLDEVYDGTLTEFKGRPIAFRTLCYCGECDGWDNVGWAVVLKTGETLLHVRPEHVDRTTQTEGD